MTLTEKLRGALPLRPVQDQAGTAAEAAGRAEQSAQDAHHHQQGASVSAGHAAVSAAHAVGAASTLMEAAGQAAQQSATEKLQIQKLMQIVAAALPNVGINDTETIRVSQPPHILFS